MTDLIGWFATALFASSYLARTARGLRLVQAGAALLWIGYGLALHAAPVVAANLIVAAAAMVTMRHCPKGAPRAAKANMSGGACGDPVPPPCSGR